MGNLKKILLFKFYNADHEDSQQAEHSSLPPPLPHFLQVQMGSVIS